MVFFQPKQGNILLCELARRQDFPARRPASVDDYYARVLTQLNGRDVDEGRGIWKRSKHLDGKARCEMLSRGACPRERDVWPRVEGVE